MYNEFQLTYIGGSAMLVWSPDMLDTQVILGGSVFQRFEIAERINFGGTQRLAINKLVGGNRLVDTLNFDPDDIEWPGRFRGSAALQRAQALDRLPQLGQQVTLSRGGLADQVVIDFASFQYERAYEIPYRIVCTVA